MCATTGRLVVLEAAVAAEAATETIMTTTTTATTATSAITALTLIVDHVRDNSTSAATKGEQGPGC